MGDGNLLSLRWNNHITNFKFTLGQLQQRDLYSDATIACEDHFYPVHKFVLSTCSDYFANMFERTPCKHPVIVLKDVSSRDIEFLLSYMYGGEVSVAQADLPSLIRAAETLHIKGLVAPDDPPTSPQGAKTASSGSEKEGEETPSKKPRLENSTSIDEDKQSTSVKTEVEDDYVSIPETDTESESRNKDEGVARIPFTNTDVIPMNTNESNFYEGETFTDLQVKQENEEEMALVDSLNSRQGTNFESNQTQSSLTTADSESMSWPSSFLSCSMSSGLNNGISTSNISHRTTNPLYPPRQSSASGEDCQMLESKMVVGDPNLKPKDNITPPDNHLNVTGMPLLQSQHSFRCPLCDYVTHNRSWLYIHLRKHTGEKPYSCPYCPFRSAQRGNLNVHIRKLHSSPSAVRSQNIRSSSNGSFYFSSEPPGPASNRWTCLSKESPQDTVPKSKST